MEQIKTVNPEDKYLLEIDKSVNEIKNSIEELSRLAIESYDKPREENEDNLYEEIINTIRRLKPESIPTFKSLMLKVDPEIDNRNSLVQKFLISMTITEYLFYIKGKYNLKGVDITNIIMGIPYYSDNTVWLNQMNGYVIPTMLKYNLL